MLRRWWPLLAVAVLLVAAGASASMTRLPLTRVINDGAVGEPAPVEESMGPIPSLEPRVPTRIEVPSWLVLGLLGLVAAVFAAVVIAFLVAGVRHSSRFSRRSVRRGTTPPKPAEVSVGDQVMAALDAGLVELDVADADPRRAVIACWVRLESAAAAAGTPRLPGDTSTDLVLRLLAGHRLSAPVLTGFADVYRRARYAARHEVDEGMRDQARAALSRLRDELAGVAA